MLTFFAEAYTLDNWDVCDIHYFNHWTMKKKYLGQEFPSFLACLCRSTGRCYCQSDVGIGLGVGVGYTLSLQQSFFFM